MGVGTEEPNPSSQLEVVSLDKGVLIPRLKLGSLNDGATISGGNVESLLVYNTNNVDNALYPGYYYWNGGRWVRLLSSVEIEDVLTSERVTTSLSANQGRILSEVKLDRVLDTAHIYIGGEGNVAEIKRINGDASLDKDGFLSLSENVVSSDELSQMGAGDKQILRWNDPAGVWEPSQAGNKTYTEVFEVQVDGSGIFMLKNVPVPGFVIDNFHVTINGIPLEGDDFIYDRESNSVGIERMPIAKYDIVAVMYQSND